MKPNAWLILNNSSYVRASYVILIVFNFGLYTQFIILQPSCLVLFVHFSAMCCYTSAHYGLFLEMMTRSPLYVITVLGRHLFDRICSHFKREAFSYRHRAFSSRRWAFWSRHNVWGGLFQPKAFWYGIWFLFCKVLYLLKVKLWSLKLERGQNVICFYFENS